MSNLNSRLKKLEADARENQDASGTPMEHPRAIMFVPFGVTVSDANLASLEAAERERQDRSTGVIFVPYREPEAADHGRTGGTS